MRSEGITDRNADRRATLRRELAWVIAIKVVALTLLWALFFRDAERPRIDSVAVSSRLAVDADHLEAHK